jgi:hypothetical protein
MALGDSLQKLIAHRQRAGAGTAAKVDEREITFAPVIQSLRKLISGVDGRYIKSKLTKTRAVIRVGNRGIDSGWEVAPGNANEDPNGASDQSIKLIETRDFMSDERTSSTLWFADQESLVAYLEREINAQISGYSG